MFDGFLTFFRQQWGRHIRHPALWVVIVGTMIGARYIIPLPGEGYVTLSVNNAYPVANSGVIGLQLGVVAALLLTPLAYIFLRAGPTKIQPYQIGDVTPARRFARNLGQGSADTAILWLVLFLIGISGIILSLFRLPLSEIRPLHTIAVMFVVAAPSLALIAAIRVLFDARPFLRGAGGDFVFFLIWMFGNVIAASMFMSPDVNLFQDVFGFASSVFVASDEQVTALAVGAAPTTDRLIELYPLRGLTDMRLLSARGFWLLFSFALMTAAALVYKPRRPVAKPKRRLFQRLFAGLSVLGGVVARPLVQSFGVFGAGIKSFASQILSPAWLVLILILMALAGFVFPFRRGVGAGLMLILIFMLSRQSALWEARSLRELRGTFGVSNGSQWILSYGAAVLIGILVMVPSFVRALSQGELLILRDMGLIVFAMPLFLLAAGYITRSATPGRLVMLGVWYGYLNLA